MRTTPYVLGALLSFSGCVATVSQDPGPPDETGGMTGTTGGAHTGGSSATGGRPATGGVTQTGGAPQTGGVATGGRVNTTGGQEQGGRPSPTGGSGRAGTPGGATGGSGMAGRGGSRATGGGTGSGGTGGSNVTPTSCSDADKSVSSNGTGRHCNYTYEYWKDSGNGTLTLNKEGFSIQWSSVNDLLGRKGQRPGSANLAVTYQADYQPNGNSYLCIYGWTKNPLVEYYIVDSWGNWRPPGGQGRVGSVTSDGGTYDIYKIARNGPNIEGNGAFTQYWSVRTQKITNSTITVGNHFNAWKNAGMPMGSLYEVSMTVEGYQSSGKADVKFSMK